MTRDKKDILLDIIKELCATYQSSLIPSDVIIAELKQYMSLNYAHRLKGQWRFKSILINGHLFWRIPHLEGEPYYPPRPSLGESKKLKLKTLKSSGVSTS